MPDDAEITNAANALRQWLEGEGARIADTRGLLDGLIGRLHRAGVPVDRTFLTVQAVHPQIVASGYEWQRGRSTVELPYTVAAQESAVYLSSPVKPIHDGADIVRARLAGAERPRAYPLFDKLAAEGYTDYAALAVTFGSGERNAWTLATLRDGGFADRDIALLQGVVPAFAQALEIRSLRRTAAALLDAYVGHEAAKRILKGEFRRGVGEAIDAVIFFADMRGFTALSDSRPTAEVVAVLNLFFDALASAIHAHGGQVLKFMGDGLLALFPVADAAFIHYSCRQAMEAALEARAAVDAINKPRVAEGFAPIRYNAALHIGEVVFGNIGAVDRLDFTAIGAAVNLAARLEALASRLGVHMVMSAAFAAAAREYRALLPLGRHALKGMAEPVEAFTLPEFAPAPVPASP